MDNFVVIDCGTSSCRAALVSAGGNIIRIARRPIQVDRPQPYFAEVDTDGLWQQVCSALSELFEGGSTEKIAVVGVSAMLGYVLLDRHAQPLMPAAIWMDNRARAQTARILARIPQDVLYAKTGRKASPELLAPRTVLSTAMPRWWQKRCPPSLTASGALRLTTVTKTVRAIPSATICTACSWPKLRWI